ncbi:Dihydrolipoyllysine-residue acetyltransferase component of pyruvate dehydrogenase complex, mitochondrial [Hondaea fermentalgiana]|uniref:Dihydrolipoamide acetyltransferase component of pyruvate dehydrogenase complex n=1 Tax=Hondaea fermentalgiana TaxID=2315210 RepID=A0A2R5GIQ9_9STRA|nr:Dihydrolipoyllysine-residue acetyltransferase component of pyruvate dehydrogenase complex, mitochondrial [Hondaea fermentalgiana]|eukprot:GBG30776.1 Dihydrolipoyllysine-residue acetyltransferase component of pyruvate dehydrogenase complex, mitochondrial [Hondaea fermentalgiana]
MPAAMGMTRPWTTARALSGGPALPEGASMLALPALSPTMDSGRVAAWTVEELGSFSAGQSICEVETDKATVDLEVQDDGFLAKQLVQAGSDTLDVGSPIAVIAESLEVAKEVQAMDLSSLLAGGSDDAASSSSSSSSSETSSASDDAAAPSGPIPAKQLVSPAAASILASYGVDPSTVAGSLKSPNGTPIIGKSDALKAVKGKDLVDQSASAKKAAPAQTSQPQQQAQPQQQQQQQAPKAKREEVVVPESEPEREYEDVAMTNMRKVIASRLTEAKQSRPHFYATIDCEIDAILAMRKELKAALGSAPSINDMILKAAALALRDVPRVNCRVEPDGSIVQNDSVDVAVAVATPTGLITPIVKNTDQKGVTQISADMRDLAGRARENKLKLEEFQGGSFAVSNLGMFGITDFTAVISPPHSAIMAVGGGRQEFVCPTDDPADMKVVNMLTVQLSADRRVVDDLTMGQFLQVFQAYMAKPMLMNL